MSLKLYGNDMDDETANRFLNWVFPSSTKTLNYLDLARNQLTKIPNEVASFKELTYLNVYLNWNIRSIATSSLPTFSSPVDSLWFWDNNMTTLEVDCFRGTNH